MLILLYPLISNSFSELKFVQLSAVNFVSFNNGS